jgi:CheY-like chemotaxis protein
VVLFVDDDESVRLTITFALEHLGYQVLVASGATEALAHVVSHPNLDLMITDIRMREMSGLDLAQLVREHHPLIKVMYCTGATPEWLFEAGIEIAADSYLLKPVSLPELKAKLERVLGDPAA